MESNDPDAWKSYPGAPEPGSILCTLGDLPDRSARCLELEGFPILFIRSASKVHAYVNACPHQFLPLNYKGTSILSADGLMIRCTSHGAGFSVETGEGLEGPGIGECLDRVPVEVIGDDVVVAK